MEAVAQQIRDLFDEVDALLKGAPDGFVAWAWERYEDSSDQSDEEFRFFDRLTDYI
ncbi:hypothetical protein FWG95_04000 [Candidatus Saccharibacteria bacterium]|nr:hypothetical protein [Candidatus Saccharibacteria bacterium]